MGQSKILHHTLEDTVSRGIEAVTLENQSESECKPGTAPKQQNSKTQPKAQRPEALRDITLQPEKTYQTWLKSLPLRLHPKPRENVPETHPGVGPGRATAGLWYSVLRFRVQGL